MIIKCQYKLIVKIIIFVKKPHAVRIEHRALTHDHAPEGGHADHEDRPVTMVGVWLFDKNDYLNNQFILTFDVHKHHNYVNKDAFTHPYLPK